ncbi:MAG: ATP-binding protein [Chloroflexi bacterium]|nr:ATP-binding protein [Chloroflexota bacterium]
MVAVILITVGMTAFFANRAASAEIARVQDRDEIARDQRLTTLLTRDYLQNSGWSGTQRILERAAQLSGERIVVADDNGTVVADSHQSFIGRQMEPDISGRASVLIGGDRGTLGALLISPNLPPSSQTPPSADIAPHGPSLNLLLILSGLLAVGVAMILTFFVSHRILSRVESLSRVSRMAAHRDFSGRAEVTSRDEVGELARTFNSMLEELSRTEELRRNLVADVVHELRTPVTNIRGYVEGIADGVIQPDNATLDSIHSETLLLARLIEDLQDLALAESGQMQLRFQPCNLDSLVRSASNSMQPSTNAKQVGLIVMDSSDIVIDADPQRINQVLRNLLANALMHTPTEGQIQIKTNLQNGNVLVSVKDTGPGIPPEELGHIFDRFYRVDKSRSRSTGGVGLGLTITKHLVEAHDGTIEAFSPEGQGTEFVVTLPRHHAS